MLRLAIALLLVCAGGPCVIGQEFAPVSFKQHPAASDVAAIFSDMSITLKNVEEPASQLATSEWSFDRAQKIHSEIETLRSLLKTWTLLLQQDQEMPYASDLFTIYSMFRDIQEECNDLSDGAANGASVEDLKRRTVLIKNLASSYAMPGALEPAVYDSILQLEQATRHAPKKSAANSRNHR